jgi:hypothetical protein
MATVAEKAFMARIKEMDCIACGNWGVDCHHITSCGRRLGNMYCLPLCPMCHRFGEISIKASVPKFEKFWKRTQIEMLQEVYQILGMEYVPKVSKVYGRTNTK